MAFLLSFGWATPRAAIETTIVRDDGFRVYNGIGRMFTTTGDSFRGSIATV